MHSTLRKLVFVNRRMTFSDLVDTVGVSKRSTNTIFKDILGLKRVKSRLVSKQLNLFEKEYSLFVIFSPKIRCISFLI